ncbi:MAG: hypothetical protein WCR87_02555, partial [Saccharofermentanales bacterium]
MDAIGSLSKEGAQRRKARVGVFAVGHDTYWGQFEGLLDKLMEYHRDVIGLVSENGAGVEVIDYGMVDSSVKSYEALDRMKADRLDLVFCDMVTYATSSTFAPVIRDIDAPVVLLALQPREAMDYTKASTRMQLENDNICSVPEFTCTAERMGRQVADVVIGTLYGDEAAESEISRWCTIAKVLHSLKGARIGLMGHVLEAMYDMHSDPAAVSRTFGMHVPLLEIEDAVRVYQTVTDEQTEERKKLISEIFDMPDPKSDPITMKLTDSDL